MIGILRGLLLLAGILFPILKLCGLPLLVSTSWLLVFSPLIAWGVLFVTKLMLVIGVIGGVIGAAAATKRR